MIANPAVSVNTAKTRAWVLAFAIDAGPVRGTVRVDVALRSAVRRGAYHLRLATAFASVADSSWKVRIWPARIWIAGINFFDYRLYG